VAYNNPGVRQRFGGNARSPSKGQLDFRGRSGQQVLNPGTGRSSLGNNRPAERSSAADRARGNEVRQAKRPASQMNRKVRGPVAQAQPRRVAHAQRAVHRGGASVGSGRHRSFAYAARGRIGGRGFAGRGGGFGGRRGARRSDARLKHDILLLGRLDNGLGYYRFAYNGSNRIYVGVLAQEVEAIAPQAVVRGRDGYLSVLYDKLGVKFQTYEQWIASGAHVPGRSGPGSATVPATRRYDSIRLRQ
jgi:hypothetical protein